MKKLWGGRFKGELAQSAKDYSYSLRVDQMLLPYDIAVSTAHVRMLARVRIITKKEATTIERGLRAVLTAYGARDLAEYADTYEDVHTFIQLQLEKKVGPVAKKLHTGRSRNDLVITCTRLYIKDACDIVTDRIVELQKVLVGVAEKNKDVIIPGFTHLQRAQVVMLAHHLLAYVEMLSRDAERFADAFRRADEMPLGSGALSGSTLKLDRTFTARELGFARISNNSLDAVSDRDSLVETVSAAAILFMHLSRLCEDLILWNTSEFGFIELSDGYSTGSSLMPQKKNPDMFELCRGRAGAVYGNLMALLTTMKGLPLAYNRDMQEDKRPLFEAVFQSVTSLDVMAGAVKTMKIHKDRCETAIHDSFLYATDVLDYFVRRGVAFKDAHELVGKMVLFSQQQKKDMRFFSLAEFRQFTKNVDRSIFACFKAENSVAAKTAVGATSPKRVAERITYWKKHLAT